MEAKPDDIPAFLRTKIDEIATNEGFTNFTITQTPGARNGSGFVAIIVRVYITGTRNGRKDELRLICKCAPENEARRETFGVMPAFERETIAYRDILTEFEKFQCDKGLTRAGPGWWSAPKCYYAEYDVATGNTAVVLEDLCARGLEMFEPNTASNYEQTKIVLEELGKFHAVSFALKAQCPEKYEKFKKLKDLQVKLMDNPMMITHLEQNAQKCAKSLGPEDKDIKEKFLKFCDISFKEQHIAVSDEIAGPYAIMVHSDIWINNAMFRTAASGKIDTAAIMDWQFISYASPAVDLIIYIFCSTNKQLRDQHYHELLDIYYREFSLLLTILGNDPEILFPRTALDDQLRKVGRYGLAMSLFSIPALCSKEPHNLDDMAEQLKEKNTEEEATSDENTEHFNEWMSGNIIDCFQYGFMEFSGL